jgi:hypothetical protein
MLLAPETGLPILASKWRQVGALNFEGEALSSKDGCSVFSPER